MALCLLRVMDNETNTPTHHICFDLGYQMGSQLVVQEYMYLYRYYNYVRQN